MKDLIIYTEPKSDDVLEWNETTGRYQLTLAYIKTLCDALPYKNDSIAKRKIKQNSLRVYQYIANHTNSVNRLVINFLLNTTEQGRKFLIECLTAQMEADMDYGYNDLFVRPVINAQTGQEGNRIVYDENAISLETESIINDSANYFGFNLCVLFPLPWHLFDLARKYED